MPDSVKGSLDVRCNSPDFTVFIYSMINSFFKYCQYISSWPRETKVGINKKKNKKTLHFKNQQMAL